MSNGKTYKTKIWSWVLNGHIHRECVLCQGISGHLLWTSVLFAQSAWSLKFWKSLLSEATGRSHWIPSVNDLIALTSGGLWYCSSILTFNLLMKYYATQIPMKIYVCSYAFILTFKYIQIFPPQITLKSFLKAGRGNIFHLPGL